MCVSVGCFTLTVSSKTVDTNTYYISSESDNISEEIKAAIKLLNPSETSPAQIIVEKGSYDVEKISIKSSYLTIDANNSTFNFSTSGAYCFMISDNSSNLTIENLNVNYGSKGFLIKDSKNIKLNNVNIRNVSDNGIHITNNVTADITNCTVENSKSSGLIVQYSSNVNLLNSSFDNNGYNGISVTRSSTVNAENCQANNNKENGISPYGANQKNNYFKAVNCTFNNNGRHGVAGTDNFQIDMTDCVTNNNHDCGIMLRDNCSSNGLYNITSNGNAYGIQIITGSTCKKIEKCKIYSSKSSGICLQNINTSISNVDIQQTKGNGIVVQSTKPSYNVIVSDCTIKSNSLSGIQNKVSKLTLKGKNNISSNKASGVVSHNGSMYITSATIYNNKDKQVVFDYSKGYLRNSKISGGEYGVSVANNSTLTDLSLNTIQNVSKAGVSLCKSKVTSMSKNQMLNPKATFNYVIGTGSKGPVGTVNVYPITLKAKVNSNVISGTFKTKKSLIVFVNGKKYKVSVNKKSNYSVKLSAKLKKKDTVIVQYTDKYSNKYYIKNTI